MAWVDGGAICPFTGMTPPDTGTAPFVFNQDGIYEYDYRLEAIANPATGTIHVALFNLNVSDTIVGSDVQTPTGATGFVDLHSHGIASFLAGDNVTLQNRGQTFDLVSGAQINGSLRFVQIG